MTYDEAIRFWFGRINYEVKSAKPADLKLERMRAFLARLGNPHERLRVVHITGTKGKGSTAAMLAAVLQAAGYRTGLFTSPHLSQVEERMRIDGVPITAAELTALLAEVAPVVEELAGSVYQAPTFFEIGTALGFLHFVRRRVEVALIEVGLGGRFDSTNVCTPLVSVITSIGWDHMAQLGATIEAIAYQKAGIIKRRVPVVSGVTQADAQAVIEREAQRAGSVLQQRGRDFRFEYEPGRFVANGAEQAPTVIVTTARKWRPLTLRLLGEHQAANAALVVATVERLREVGLTISDAAVAHGLATVVWPSRVQVVGRKPFVILDSAHNVPSAEALVETLRSSFSVAGRKSVVFAVSSDKQYGPMLEVLAGYFDHFYLTRYGSNPRCVPPDRLAEILARVAPSVRHSVYAGASEAWAAARSAAGPEDLLCVTGSMFLAGELQSAVGG
jgi:dihydrofolate synthase/folylpolyglutamate synthase